MKYICLFTFLCFFIFVQGQERLLPHDNFPGNLSNYKPAYQSNFPDWAKKLYQENPNFQDISHAYHQWKQRANNNFKPIERYYKIWSKLVQPYVTADGSIDITHAYQYHENLCNSQLQTNTRSKEKVRNIGDWKFLGPKETFWLNESGSPDTPNACPWQANIYAFDVSEEDFSILYCGTETGFMNKSTDNGMTWNLLAQDYPFGGGITSVAVHPKNDDIVYATAGGQIHKTIDGGLTWTPLLSSGEFIPADKVHIDPMNPSKVFTAGATGVHISLDDGASWTKVWNHTSYDIHNKPGSTDTIYCMSSISGQFAIGLSTNGGMSFEADANFPTQINNSSGALIAVTPAEHEALYAILLSNDNTPLLYKGTMHTGTWALLATGQTNAFPMNNGQGFFDLVLEVSPLDPNLVFAGTTTLYKSTNGGTNFSIIGGYGGSFPIHPDIQAMKILTDGSTWVSTDGGFTHSTDNFTIVSNAHARNNFLVGSDMWGFDQGWNEDIIVGGRYHNGNTAIADFYQPKALRMGGAESPTGWIMKGKSKYVAFNDLGAGWILPNEAETQPLGRFPFSKYPNMDEYGGRRGNLFFHPNYYETLYLGEGNAFWKSTDMGQSFEMLYDFGERIRYCQIAFSDPNIMYADVVNQGLYRSEDGGYSWELKPTLTDGSHGTSFWRGKLHIEISPMDANVIYACLQNGTWSADRGKIFRSTDGGDTWENWSGSLNEFTKVLVLQPDETGQDLVYLFTSNRSGAPGKCYMRRQNDTDWSIYGSDYPAGMSPIHALAFFRDSKIRIGGNGGVWENELAAPDFVPVVQPWINKPFSNCMLDTLQLEDHSIVNHENCSWTWDITPTPSYIEHANMRNPKIVLGAPGTYDVTLTITKNGNAYTKTIEEMITTTECPSLDNCDNPAILPVDVWNLEYVDSEETNYPGLATMAFDNDPSTIWHTRWSTGSDPYPHEIQVDLGANYDVGEFIYYPRQNGQNGWIKDYELYFTEDLNDWGTADTIGVFAATPEPHKVTFSTPVTGRYFRLVALSEVNGNPWASAAEFEIKGCYHQVTPVKDIELTSLKAFPIPSSGIFTVPMPKNGLFECEVYSISGQLIRKAVLESKDRSLEIDLHDAMDGFYLLKLKDDQKRLYKVKLLKQR